MIDETIGNNTLTNNEQSQEMTMWDKFRQVLNLGDAWADEDGKGEWIFSTGSCVSVRFQTLDDMDELDGILDMFEEASEDEKEGLKDSLNQEGYVSYFQYTVTITSGEEYYFNQLTGGGGEPVVEDFYCENEQKLGIEKALDSIISLGFIPQPMDKLSNNSGSDPENYLGQSLDDGKIPTSPPDFETTHGKLIWLILNCNDAGWFTDENHEIYSFPDGTKLIAELHSYDDVSLFLEEYDEMNLWRQTDFDGIDYSSDEIGDTLNNEGNLLMFEYTLDFSESPSIGSGFVVYKFIQCGEGLEIGAGIMMTDDIAMEKHESWLDNAISNEWKLDSIA
jgi:hypothetical protein